MADLLTHVLAAYVIGTVLSFRYAWLTPQYVTIAMIGAILPDLNRLSLVVADYWMEVSLGLPFSWFGMHTIGGVVLMSVAGAVLAGSQLRRRVLGLLLMGALSHLAFDALLYLPSGVLPTLWWPLTDLRLPTPGVYMSYDRTPLVLIIGLAAVVWYIRQRVDISEARSSNEL